MAQSCNYHLYNGKVTKILLAFFNLTVIPLSVRPLELHASPNQSLEDSNHNLLDAISIQTCLLRYK